MKKWLWEGILSKEKKWVIIIMNVCVWQSVSLFLLRFGFKIAAPNGESEKRPWEERVRIFSMATIYSTVQTWLVSQERHFRFRPPWTPCGRVAFHTWRGSTLWWQCSRLAWLDWQAIIFTAKSHSVDCCQITWSTLRHQALYQTFSWPLGSTWLLLALQCLRLYHRRCGFLSSMIL